MRFYRLVAHGYRPSGLLMAGALLAFPLVAVAAQTSETDTSVITVTSTAIAVAGDTLPPAYAGGQVANGGRLGVLGEVDAQQVPFSVISYTAEQVRNQQADSLAEVVINDASVQAEKGYGNYSEAFKVRGFTLDGEDISYGGLYGVLPRQVVSPLGAERIELFRGSNSFANGIPPGGSGVGGAINLEPARATEAPINRFSLEYQGASRTGGQIDVGRRFGEENQYGVRFNAEQREGGTAINGESNHRTAATLGLDYRGDRLRTSLDLGYQKDVINGGRSVVYTGGLSDIPRAPDSDTNYAPSWAGTSLESTWGMARAEYDLTPDWMLYGGIGGNTTHEAGEYSSPTPSNDNGDATASRLGVPYRAHSISGMAGLRGHFETGSARHTVNLGYSQIYRKTRTAYTLSSSFDTNLYDPVDVAYPATLFSGGDLDDPNVRSRIHSNGVALSDTVALFDERLLLTLGGRYQRVEVSNYSYDGDETTRDADQRITPVYGVVYQPVDHVALYANHIEALQPGDTAPSTASNGGDVLGIAHSKQNEAGIKLDYGNVGGSLAVFEIRRPSGALGSDNVYALNGEQRNRGVEFNIFGEPMAGIRLLGSATWMDPELTHTEGGTNDGNDAVGVPEYRWVLGGEWDVPGVSALTLTSRVIRTGPQYADAANTLELDPWTRWDVGGRYVMALNQQTLTWRLNILNLTDNNYWASASEGYLTQGEPRTVKLSATLDF